VSKQTDPRLPALLIAVAVAVAFADSSIVVLALPELYARFDTSIVGVSWVITAYNLVVAVGAFALIGVVRRVDPRRLSVIGLGLFCIGSVGCALAQSLSVLIVFRCVQGAGAAMLLAGSLGLLSGLRGSRTRGVASWIAAGTFGAALGPALGGILTQLFDWRAIFVFQAPVALFAMLVALRSPEQPARGTGRPAVAANLGLALLFGALVGALFLSVLLLVTVWGRSPIAGAAVLSAVPLATLGARWLNSDLSPGAAAVSGASLLAAGLLALALLPATSTVIVVAALALCGVGMGLAVPILTRDAVRPDDGLIHDGTVTIGARHLGLVLALVLVAPLLSTDLERGGRNALLGGTKVLLSSTLPIRQEVPIALAIRDELQKAPRGAVPDVAKPFNDHGAANDPSVRRVRDSLVGAIQDALTRSFRRALLLCGVLAALSLVPILVTLRRRVAA
jgi:predicted MFS family arabinose efflux permease